VNGVMARSLTVISESELSLTPQHDLPCVRYLVVRSAITPVVLERVEADPILVE
jgi:hypothetical protein